MIVADFSKPCNNGLAALRGVMGNVVDNSEAAKEHSAFVRNGLDRVDSNLGYTLDNVLPCCSICNYAKQDLRQDVFMQWIARAYLHSFGGGK